jgi:hypothetical protein
MYLMVTYIVAFCCASVQLAAALSRKEKGNAAYKAGRLARAARQYSAAVEAANSIQERDLSPNPAGEGEGESSTCPQCIGCYFATALLLFCSCQLSDTVPTHPAGEGGGSHQKRQFCPHWLKPCCIVYCCVVCMLLARTHVVALVY